MFSHILIKKKKKRKNINVKPAGYLREGNRVKSGIVVYSSARKMGTKIPEV